MFESPQPAAAPRVWEVGALCRAIADALEARFNPVAVRGEITGFSRASSGHCYFSIKDASGQLRCAMFRRAAACLTFRRAMANWWKCAGAWGVRAAWRSAVHRREHAARGAGRFVRAVPAPQSPAGGEGLFDPRRKRPLPLQPRGIGLVTSLGAAALHDVVTALRRRVPHIPVVLIPALVQALQRPNPW
jgi:exodeoxyribonuclease VII large subunit